MKFNEMEHFPEKAPLPPESQERINLINKTLYQLENLSDFHLNSKEGREGLRIALNLVFSYITSIEEGEYEIVGLIKARIRDTYSQLYEIGFNGPLNTPAAGEFYGEIGEIMELIENCGKQFIEDMDIYQKFNDEQKAA